MCGRFTQHLSWEELQRLADLTLWLTKTHSEAPSLSAALLWLFGYVIAGSLPSSGKMARGPDQSKTAMLEFIAFPHFLRWSAAVTWLMTPHGWNYATRTIR